MDPLSHDLTFEPLKEREASADALLARHHALMRATSPEESCHVLTADALWAGGARVFVGRGRDGAVLAIGAYVPFALDGRRCAELKSMHCHDLLRGCGAGKALLQILLDAARSEGIEAVMLETGSASEFTSARGLYSAAGFSEFPPFGSYVADPLSVFMARDL